MEPSKTAGTLASFQLAAAEDEVQNSVVQKSLNSLSAEAYSRWLARHKGFVLAVFALLTVVGAALAPLSFSQMTTDVPAASGSYSEHASDVVRAHFPGKVSEHVVAILVSRFDGGPILGEDGQGALLVQLTQHMLDRIQHLKDEGAVKRVDSWSAYSTLPQLRQSFLSADGEVSIVAVHYDSHFTKKVIPEVRAAMRSPPESTAGELRVLLTGLAAINQASLEGVLENLRDMDSIAFPLALLLLGVALCSLRLTILPVVSVISAATLSFGVLMSGLTAIYPIFILAGSMMMSLLIAMSVDYSLFVLGRFQAEVRAKPAAGSDLSAHVEAAVARSLATAGHTVLVSGTTLVLSFLGLILTRENFMTSMGAGCAMAIMSSMITALVLTPALLLTFPRFFSRSPQHEQTQDIDDVALQKAFNMEHCTLHMPGTEQQGGELLTIVEAKALSKTRWFRFASAVLKYKLPVSILLLLVCCWPLARLPHMELSRSPLFCVPLGNEAFLGFSQALEHFGAGLLWPTRVLVLAPPGASVLSRDFFDRVATSIEEAKAKLPPTPGMTVQSLVFYNDKRVPLSVVEATQVACAQGLASHTARHVFCNSLPDWCENLDLLCMARHELVNHDESAMVLNLELKGDPWAEDGGAWLQGLRKAFPQDAPERYYVISNPSSVMDTMHNIYSSAPLVLLVTVFVVFGVVAWSFKSVVVPLRLLPSIALTICWTYGMSVLVYQDGILHWMGISSLAPAPGGVAAGVAWVLPALCFTILTGLCLDYDIFVLSRVEEFRLAGFSDHDSVILGVSSTGQTITVAGCIMLTAFSGLLLSKQLMLNQLSFFLIFCVILDTFVVRTILVPICMDVLGGCSNWWPRKMPPVTQSAIPT